MSGVRVSGILEIRCLCLVFLFFVFCLLVSRLLLSHGPNPETRHSGLGTQYSELGTRSSGHCMWELGHQIFKCLSYSYFACNVVLYFLIDVLGCLVF